MSATSAAGTLLVLDALPLPLTEGDRLRSHHLARALAAAGPCVLAALPGNPDQLEAVRRSGLFAEVLLLPPRPAKGRWQRHLRTDNGRYLATGWPDWLETCRAQLHALAERHAVDAVIAGKLTVAELVAGLAPYPRIVDDFDCYTLTLERALATHDAAVSTAGRLAQRVALARYRRQESRLAADFQLVTTISPVDAARLSALSPAADVRVVPNGVDARFFAAEAPPSDAAVAGGAAAAAGGVLFWGNLGFAPNRTAVRFFVEEVYAPHLAPRGIPFTLAGAGADGWIAGLARRFPQLTTPGFVADLPALVAAHPVVVNPMVSGSGLKNKVLEAFAASRAVVSTSIGCEAIVGAEPGVHYLAADEPEAFAGRVLDLLAAPSRAAALGARARALVEAHYRWECVERRWREVVDAARSAQRGIGGAETAAPR